MKINDRLLRNIPGLAFAPEDKCFVTFPSDPLTVPRYSSSSVEAIIFAPNTTARGECMS